jgi:MurNAc alpha-1-phosphate uridylyltransferase
MNRAMILAAGRGERMGELTAHEPKPLLRVGNHLLIEYAIFRIKQAGIHEIIINVSYRGEQIKTALGDGSQYGVKLTYSDEPERLETGGGIFQALPFFGNEPFLVVSADVITDFPLQQLPTVPEGLAHLVMVKNPSYHPRGDYGLANGKIIRAHENLLTFANVGVYRPELFAQCEPGHFKLTRVLNPAIEASAVTGEQYNGSWFNIGTAEDLQEVNLRIREVS